MDIVGTLSDANVYGGLADYSDIWTAFWRTFEDLLSRALYPEDADELLELISLRLSREIRTRTFVVPFVGVELKDIDELPLGKMKLIRPSVAYLDAAGVDHAHAKVQSVIDAQKGNLLWLSGTAEGTPRVSEQRFREQAELATGMLAVAAASMYVGGASAFRIGLNMSGQEGDGRANPDISPAL